MNLREFMEDRLSEELDVFVNQLFEGGAFGHLSHPYENLGLSFGQIKQMINDIFSGKLEAYEKIDGQQISISWKNGKLVGARNKGQLKNSGAEAFTVDQAPAFFGARGNVPTPVIQSFHNAMKDLQSALSKISPDVLQSVFQNGKRFMNTEVVTQETQNVVPYFKNYLVLHGLIEYDVEGDPVKSIGGSAQNLEAILKSVNAANQSKFEIRGPNKVVMKNFNELPLEKRKIMDELKHIQNGLLDSETIGDFKDARWTKIIKETADTFYYDIPDDVLQMILGRWSRQEKGINSINKIVPKITSSPFKSWFAEFDKKKVDSTNKEIIRPIELFFLHLGAEVLYHSSGFLTASPDQSIAHLAKKIKDDSAAIVQSKNPDDIKKLKYELERFENLGGHAKLVGSEGIVFSMNGQLYKLTGVFASINQLLGIIKFKK